MNTWRRTIDLLVHRIIESVKRLKKTFKVLIYIHFQKATCFKIFFNFIVAFEDIKTFETLKTFVMMMITHMIFGRYFVKTMLITLRYTAFGSLLIPRHQLFIYPIVYLSLSSFDMLSCIMKNKLTSCKCLSLFYLLFLCINYHNFTNWFKVKQLLLEFEPIQLVYQHLSSVYIISYVN